MWRRRAPWLAAAADFMARRGVPDVVIANAGVSVGTLTEEAGDLAAFERVLRTNVLGMVATFQPFVAPLRARGQGRLVGIASVAGIRGLPGAGAYSASKAAAIAYLESLRVELHGSGVRVVTIAPGYIETPMTAVNRLSDALHAAGRRGGAALRAGHRGRHRLHGDPLADGCRRQASALAAESAVRPDLRPRGAQAPRVAGRRLSLS